VWVKRIALTGIGSGKCLHDPRYPTNESKAITLWEYVNKAMAASNKRLRDFDFLAMIEEVQQAKADAPDVSYTTILSQKESLLVNKIHEQMSTTSQLATIASRHDEMLGEQGKVNQNLANTLSAVSTYVQKVDEKHTANNNKMDQRVSILENFMTPRRIAIIDQMWDKSTPVISYDGPYDGSGENFSTNSTRKMKLKPKTLFEDETEDEDEDDDACVFGRLFHGPYCFALIFMDALTSPLHSFCNFHLHLLVIIIQVSRFEGWFGFKDVFCRRFEDHRAYWRRRRRRRRWFWFEGIDRCRFEDKWNAGDTGTETSAGNTATVPMACFGKDQIQGREAKFR